MSEKNSFPRNTLPRILGGALSRTPLIFRCPTVSTLSPRQAALARARASLVVSFAGSSFRAAVSEPTYRVTREKRTYTLGCRFYLLRRPQNEDETTRVLTTKVYEQNPKSSRCISRGFRKVSFRRLFSAVPVERADSIAFFPHPTLHVWPRSSNATIACFTGHPLCIALGVQRPPNCAPPSRSLESGMRVGDDSNVSESPLPLSRIRATTPRYPDGGSRVLRDRNRETVSPGKTCCA